MTKADFLLSGFKIAVITAGEFLSTRGLHRQKF
jgi:hypothetical protein